MFQWIIHLFKPSPDKVEQRLLEMFGFLINDYGFLFSKESLGNLVDDNGKLVFYGPLNAYQFYNKNVCINILHLVQIDDYYVYITNEKTKDQIYIRSGTIVPSNLAYDLQAFSRLVKESVMNQTELFGHKI